MFLSPNEIFEQLDLKENMIAADFGCSSGNWTVPLAKLLERGKVYGLDILSESLAILKNKATSEQINNIEIKQCDLEEDKGSRLPVDHVDLVLIVNTLFQCENKKAIIMEAKRILKETGQIVIIDWKKDASFGPDQKNIVLPSEIEKIASSIQLQKTKNLEAGDCHYGLVFQK